jgi:hypothetical protein
VIAVFTKYDHFKRDVRFKLEDQGRDPTNNSALLKTEVEKVFEEQYLANLKRSAPFVRLESENFVNLLGMCYNNFCPTGMHKHDQKCTELLEETVNQLSGSIVALMLLAVQKDNLELNIKEAVRR